MVISQPAIRAEQTACVLALHMDFADNKKNVRETLRSLVREAGHLTTGFLGTPWLLTELPEQEAWELLLREEYPSWLYEVKLGDTTVWERWNSLTPEGCFSETGMNSLNHYACGSAEAWICSGVCGLRPLPDSPGFRRFRWQPLPDRRAGFARCRLFSPFGEIRSERHYDEGGLVLSLAVPIGSEAEAWLPDGRKELLKPGEHNSFWISE